MRLLAGGDPDRNDTAYAVLVEAIQRRQRFTLDVLYGDHESGRRTISRFAITSRNESQWMCAVVRHWNLDHPERYRCRNPSPTFKLTIQAARPDSAARSRAASKVSNSYESSCLAPLM